MGLVLESSQSRLQKVSTMIGRNLFWDRGYKVPETHPNYWSERSACDQKSNLGRPLFGPSEVRAMHSKSGLLVFLKISAWLSSFTVFEGSPLISGVEVLGRVLVHVKKVSRSHLPRPLL